MKDELEAILNKQKQDQMLKYAKRFEKQTASNEQVLFKTNLGAPRGGNLGDFFPDYKVGNRTYLNTLANPHIAYFVELRRKFRFTFNPGPVLRSRINQISRGRITVVWGVSVDKSGKVNGLTLIRSSGIRAYDREAKRTITASAPFSSPPTNLLRAKDNMLHMAWTFVVYL